jgi:prenyltransferase beta subunit
MVVGWRMSFRLKMLQVARVAPKVLGEATDLVAGFLRSRQHACGGFMDREDKPDLYYTVFGMEGLMALRAEVDEGRVREWLRGFGDGEGLDFVHLCCLSRCWSSLGMTGLDGAIKEGLLARVEAFRSEDGGYNQAPGKRHGTAYGCLLGWSAYEDLGRRAPESERLLESLLALRTGDGGWANERGMPIGVTPAAAAAVALCRHLEMPPDEQVRDWLLEQVVPDGGFRALPGVPIPDLLSTAVGLHALDALQADFSGIRERCLDFVDSLWNAEGGFHGNWTDDDLDCEYTYYGLLALGHLGM